GHVALHLHQQLLAVAEQTGIGARDRLERLVALLALGRLPERLERDLRAAVDGRDEQILLRSEQPEEVRLRDAGATGDGVGRRAVEALVRELGERRLDDLLPALLRRLPLSRPYHGK